MIEPEAVLAAADLMSQYSDTPMDFADATLVLLADVLGVADILTLNRRGFSKYRAAKGKAFRFVPVPRLRACARIRLTVRSRRR